MFVSVYNHVFIVLYILLIVKYQFLLLWWWHHLETGGVLISWNSWWENEYSVYLLLYIFLLYYNVTLELLYWKSEKKKSEKKNAMVNIKSCRSLVPGLCLNSELYFNVFCCIWNRELKEKGWAFSRDFLFVSTMHFFLFISLEARN